MADLKNTGKIVFILSWLWNSVFSNPVGVVFDTLIPDNSSCFEPKGFGCLCESQNDCNLSKHLECIDFKCYCMNPMRRMYDNKLQQCVSLVGSHCSEEKTPRCIRNSECDENLNRCVCQEGYTVTSRKNCMLTYGQQCGPFQCNLERGLACKSGGTCLCLDNSYTYSSVTQSCFDPEAFVKNVLTNWFDESFFRDLFLKKILKFFHSALDVMKFKKLPKIIIVG